MATVAVKSVQGNDREALVALLVEARLHASLSHPHLVTLLGVQEARMPVYLAMEYCPLGDLRRFLQEWRTRPTSAFGSRSAVLAPAARLDMAKQVASAVEYLHHMQCLHRDLAARNVLVVESHHGFGPGDAPAPGCGYTLKLSDLGLARSFASATGTHMVRV